MKKLFTAKQYVEYEKLRVWYKQQIAFAEKEYGDDELGLADMFFEHINTIYEEEMNKIMLID